MNNNCDYFNQIKYPAGYNNVLSVGATDQNDQRGEFSTYGPHLDVSAPGVHIYSTLWNDTYGYKSGTSMAAPLVSGLAALVWSKKPNLTNYQVESIIVGTVDDLGLIGRDDYFGYGRINAAKAVDATLSSLNINLRDKISISKPYKEYSRPFKTGVVLVGLKKTLNSTEKMDLINQLNLSIVGRLESIDVLKIEVEPGLEVATIKSLSENPQVEFAEPDYETHLIE